jgi:hypothetical protein
MRKSAFEAKVKRVKRYAKQPKQPKPRWEEWEREREPEHLRRAWEDMGSGLRW